MTTCLLVLLLLTKFRSGSLIWIKGPSADVLDRILTDAGIAAYEDALRPLRLVDCVDVVGEIVAMALGIDGDALESRGGLDRQANAA